MHEPSLTALGVFGLTLVASYLLGAIPFGYLIARARGVDILHQGSGNIGATNVGRVLGRRFGLLVFFLDFAKGALPAAIASWLTKHLTLSLPSDALEVSAGLAAFLGHLFPIYLHFRGGKGVATGAGVVVILLPVPALGALLTWVALVCVTRYVSLASLAAAVVLCALRFGLTAAPFAADNLILTLFCFVAVALVFLRHRSNITRLLRGSENRLKDTPAMLHLSKTLHVLALGLWFGSAVFFTFVVALTIFNTFESLAANPQDRPAWLPESFTKEQGTQLAGLAVGPIFPWYFLLEGICGLLTVATALSWYGTESQAAVHKVRFYVLTLALVTVVVGWPIAQKVSTLRAARYVADPVLAAAARTDFATWHLYSLLLNLVTVALVTVAMALAARLPNPVPAATADTAQTLRNGAKAQGVQLTQ
jgi:acyl-phosphate glycerol 3-phosphate acyltransferase